MLPFFFPLRIMRRCSQAINLRCTLVPAANISMLLAIPERMVPKPDSCVFDESRGQNSVLKKDLHL